MRQERRERDGFRHRRTSPTAWASVRGRGSAAHRRPHLRLSPGERRPTLARPAWPRRSREQGQRQHQRPRCWPTRACSSGVCRPGDRHDYYRVAPEPVQPHDGRAAQALAAVRRRPSATPAALCQSGASGCAPGSEATRRPTPTWWTPSASRSTGGEHGAGRPRLARRRRPSGDAVSRFTGCSWPEACSLAGVRRYPERVRCARPPLPRRRCRGRPHRPPVALATPRDTSAMAAVPPDLADRIRRLSLAEIVDIGLRNNAATRLAWANAQAAAAAYGSARGEWLPAVDGDVTGDPAQDGREPGPHRGPAVGAHAERHAELPGVRLRRPERPGRGRAPAAARRRLHPQRGDPGRRAPDPGGLLPVPGQPLAARRAANHARRGAGQPGGGGGAAAGGARHHRRRAAGADRGEPGAARPPDRPRATSRPRAARSPWQLGLPANLPYDVDSTAAAVPVRGAGRQRGSR